MGTDNAPAPDYVRGMIARLKTGDLDRPLLDVSAETLRRLLAENERMRAALNKIAGHAFTGTWQAVAAQYERAAREGLGDE